jgi:hypothetical protein
MSAATSTIQFTPIQGAAANTATAAVLKVAQAEPLLSRTYYQDGRLLTAEDMSRDYTYFDQRLLDLGLALGDGIVTGLDASLTNTVISVTQGRGIAPSGRAVAYSAADPAASLKADLADRATQMTLNGPNFSGIADGLYAVVLLHAQQGSGISEVFPRDLTSTRVSYDTIVDTVEIALVSLPQPIPGGTPFQSRAQLAAHFATAQSLPTLPSDSVVLGVVAIRLHLPVWFDPSLLRHPLRAADDPNAANDDLARAYAQIYADMMAGLQAAGTPSFRAADVFRLLPAHGTLPRAAIVSATGTQTFFPDQIDVAMVPARTDEVAALLAQTEGEPPIDLTAATPAQVLVLVPLKPSDYATLVPALLGTVSSAPPPAFKPYPSIALPRIDPLVLRLPGRQPAPPTQPAVWSQIWTLAPSDLPWMVQPTDGGIGGAKAALLAAGFAVPPPPAATPGPTTTPRPTPTRTPMPPP